MLLLVSCCIVVIIVIIIVLIVVMTVVILVAAIIAVLAIFFSVFVPFANSLLVIVASTVLPKSCHKDSKVPCGSPKRRSYILNVGPMCVLYTYLDPWGCTLKHRTPRHRHPPRPQQDWNHGSNPLKGAQKAVILRPGRPSSFGPTKAPQNALLPPPRSPGPPKVWPL